MTTVSIPKEIREKLEQLAELYEALPDWQKGRLEYTMWPKNDEPRPQVARKE
jgi:hypothetical protein